MDKIDKTDKTIRSLEDINSKLGSISDTLIGINTSRSKEIADKANGMKEAISIYILKLVLGHN